MCWGCVFGPIVGGLLGNTFEDFAWHSERPLYIKALSGVSSATLTLVTTLAIKSLFHISFCGTEGFKIGRAILIVGGSTIIGIIYSLGINYVLNRWLPVSSNPYASSSCCCKHGDVHTS